MAKLRTELQGNTVMGMRSKRNTTTPEVRLGLTIRTLAGARIRDLVGWFLIKPQTIRRIFLWTLQIIVMESGIPRLPNSMEELQRSSLDFKCLESILILSQDVLDVYMVLQGKFLDQQRQNSQTPTSTGRSFSPFLFRRYAMLDTASYVSPRYTLPASIRLSMPPIPKQL